MTGVLPATMRSPMSRVGRFRPTESGEGLRMDGRVLTKERCICGGRFGRSGNFATHARGKREISQIKHFTAADVSLTAENRCRIQPNQPIASCRDATGHADATADQKPLVMKSV